MADATPNPPIPVHVTRVKGAETLSNRGAENANAPDHWEGLVNALNNPWSKKTPDGTVILGIAENALMHDELEEHLKKNFDVDRAEHFTYGHGSQGSPRLLKAISGYFNDRFKPLKPTDPSEFVVTSGVAAIIDHLTWCICDPGEGILFPMPLYTGFENDVPTRARGKLVPVSFEREDGSLVLDDVFDPEANVRCLERAYEKSKKEGVEIRAVMITNPHNPLGKCYSVEAINAIASFCEKHRIHYLSDEIYAMSVFDNPDFPKAEPFTSILSIDLEGIINPDLVHVLYGAAKDFCANGLRLGAFHTRNAALSKAMISISLFGWVPYIAQDMWARVLEDKPFLNSYLSEGQKRLAKHYKICTDMLTEHEIPYYDGGNAGLFVWVDLRKWFVGGKDPGDFRALRTSSPNIAEYRTKEDRLSKTWFSKKVMIANGSAFYSEELGWFRIVFTPEEEGLRLGLQRFIDGLQEQKKKGEL